MANLATLSPVPFKAFSGANITAVIGNRIVGTLQALTCSITREVGAVYSFGEASPRAFVKGKRGIAGSLVFTQFDRHPLLHDVFGDAFDQPIATNASLFTSRFLELANNSDLIGPGNTSAALLEGAGGTLGFSVPNDVNANVQQELLSLYNSGAKQKLRYIDQIPEFDIVVSFVNEEGDGAFLMLGGVTLVNEGWGWSLDDLTSETALTYVAKVVEPLTPSVTKGIFSDKNTGFSFAASPFLRSIPTG